MMTKKWLAIVSLPLFALACGAESFTVRPAAGPPPDRTVYGVRTTDRVAFLTIDDGVTRDPGMVKALRDAKIKATFFLTAQYVRADPGFFARLARETGSVVENHTLTHPNLEGMPRDAQRHEICGASDDLAKDFGRRPTLLRPPYGARDEATADAAAECGITHIVNWSAEIAGGRTTFAVGNRLKPGDIVLAHFRRTFAADVAEFVRQAERADLKPALLEDYLD
ncbi:polysaccharide deacetylase family protein [Actinomadura sp. B10D3]|uniref:polysaccharide deacetylase family protein n=1 Tax=Actinomadura sp. B10D3 TaxID=3153557 RepID=UPI00325EDD9D